MAKVKEIPSGTTFGYWKVIGFYKFDRRGEAVWRCRCTACGREYTVRGNPLRSGKTKHCNHCNNKGFDTT